MTNAVPRIISPWRELYKPKKYGIYVNDHSLIKARDGNWYLFGITSMSNDGPDTERYFTVGRGQSLAKGAFEEIGKVIDEGQRAWAPAVIEYEGLYYMYYGPGVTRMAVTNDPTHWMGHQIQVVGNPVMAVNRDHMVIPYEGGWLMYASGLRDGYSCVSLLRSEDLIRWEFQGYALTSSGNAPLNPPCGAFESPYVIKYREAYYLFVTYTSSLPENYHNTLVFCSEDPCSFGDYNGDNHAEIVVAELPVHAGEVLQENGRYYITTCGWNGYHIPCEGGVAIAELEFTN